MGHKINISKARLSEVPVLRTTGSGTSVLNLNVAEDTYRGQNDPKHTTWWRVTVWGARAESIAQLNLTPQNCVLNIWGQMNSNEWGNPDVFTKSNGESGASYELRADDVEIIFKGASPEGSGDRPSYSNAPVQAQEDDIPF